MVERTLHTRDAVGSSPTAGISPHHFKPMLYLIPLTWRHKSIKKLLLNEQERFWKNVRNVGEPGRCWLWKGSTNSHGYGRMTFRRISYKAHRIAYFLANGQTNDELMVLHKCDVRLCCDPLHLYQGHAKQNTQDAVRRGRHTRLYGEKNGKAKLTERQVKSIRKRYRQGGITQKALARDYGVSETTIFYVCSGERWIKLSG